MTGTRWKYRTTTVEYEGNVLELRELTAGERQAFIELNKQVKAGEKRAIDLGYYLLTSTAVGGLSAEEVAEMPQEFFDKACEAATKLAGMGDPEKKATDPAVHPNET